MAELLTAGEKEWCEKKGYKLSGEDSKEIAAALQLALLKGRLTQTERYRLIMGLGKPMEVYVQMNYDRTELARAIEAAEKGLST